LPERSVPVYYLLSIIMTELLCTECGAKYSPSSPIWKCECGGLLDVEHSEFFKIRDLADRDCNMWRYREAIPVDADSNIISLDEGFTPLTKLQINNREVYFKQEHLFPTGSFKDRGASVLLSKVKELEIGKIVEDSSGNAGAAVAAYAASAGVECKIFVPEYTGEAKLAQIKLYGAELMRVSGSREDTAAAALVAAEESYYAGHSWNPFFLHGTKTFAYEIAEQLGWSAPDALVLPVGNGTLLLGAYIGFSELQNHGITERMPKLVGVQAERCAPLYKSFREGSDVTDYYNAKKTIAEGVTVANPVRARQILDAVRTTGGFFATVTEEEITESLKKMLKTGYLIEPTAAVAVAGTTKYLSQHHEDELIVSVFTGHGLKAAGKIHKLVKEEI